jgi:hypothetical protein
MGACFFEGTPHDDVPGGCHNGPDRHVPGAAASRGSRRTKTIVPAEKSQLCFKDPQGLGLKRPNRETGDADAAARSPARRVPWS